MSNSTDTLLAQTNSLRHSNRNGRWTQTLSRLRGTDPVTLLCVCGLLLTTLSGCGKPLPKSYSLQIQLEAASEKAAVNLSEVSRLLLNDEITDEIAQRYGQDKLQGKLREFISFDQPKDPGREGLFTITVDEPTTARLAATMDWLDTLQSQNQASSKQRAEFQSTFDELQEEHTQAEAKLAAQRAKREQHLASEDWGSLKRELQSASDASRLDVDAASDLIDTYRSNATAPAASTMAQDLRSTIRDAAIPVSDQMAPDVESETNDLSDEIAQQVAKWEARVRRLESSNYGDLHPALVSARRNLAEVREAMQTRVVENPFGPVEIAAKQTKLDTLLAFIDDQITQSEATELEMLSREGELSSQVLAIRTQMEAQEKALEHIARDILPKVEILDQPELPLLPSQMEEFKRLRQL